MQVERRREEANLSPPTITRLGGKGGGLLFKMCHVTVMDYSWPFAQYSR